MRLLIMGAPGAGKGTQAGAIAQRYEIPAISTGAMFRGAVASGSELGQELAKIMESGALVPDELTEKVVAQRLEQPDAKAGFLLDGFPRTLHQVDALAEILANQKSELDAAIFLDVPREELISRLVRRGELEGRSDDTEETIAARMDTYERETKPLLETYEKAGLLLKVDGLGTVDEVNERIAKALEDRLNQD